MLKFLVRQPLNSWRSIGWLHRIESILLVGLIYIVTIGKIHRQYLDWLNYDWITQFGLTSLMTNIFSVSFFLSGPFILLYMLPRQSGLHPFYSIPLSSKQLFQLIGYYYFKYQLITTIIYLVFLSALFGINWLASIASLAMMLAFSLIIYISQFKLFIHRKSNSYFISLLLMISILYIVIYLVFFWYLNMPWIIALLILMATGLILWKQWPKENTIHLEIIFPKKSSWRANHKTSRMDFKKMPKFLPAKLQALFNKELLGLWRNPSYRRLKWITIISYVILMILILLSQIENKDLIMTLLTGLIIWLHYSNYFNEKYVQPEPDWYFYTVPFRFHHLWLSKFLVEFMFIIIILASFWIMLTIAGFNLNEQIYIILLMLSFSIVVLSIMLNFQIMFYDDPRLAGYAYHFTIIFLLIMTVNYRLVGPLISIILLSFYFYKSYRYFKS
ncbi:MAG: hypothetical protein P8Y99_03530 [Calditrichaceae bacterium]